jgi:hypothetical protein
MVKTRAQREKEAASSVWDRYFFVPVMLTFAAIAITFDSVNMTQPTGPFGELRGFFFFFFFFFSFFFFFFATLERARFFFFFFVQKLAFCIDFLI